MGIEDSTGNTEADTQQTTVYGKGDGDIPKPYWETISDKSYLLGNLQKDGSFNYRTLQSSLLDYNTAGGDAVSRFYQIDDIEERYRKLENSVDETIYKLLDINCREVEYQETIEYEDIADGTPQTKTKDIKKIIPTTENGLTPEEQQRFYKLTPEEQQRFYNMKYYIFSNLSAGKPHLSKAQCDNFVKNLDNNLLQLDNTALNYLKETSDVTKLTCILGAATEGKQPITNLNYIKDSNAEIILRRETGAFFTHSVDDYMRYSDKKSMADIDEPGLSTEKRLVLMGQEASLEKKGFMVALACMGIAIILGITLAPISTALAVGWATGFALTGIASYLLIPYFGKQLVTQDNYNSLLDDVKKQMEKNIEQLKTGEAFELLGKVDALLHKAPDDIALQNYQKQLENLQVVKDTKNSKHFEKLTDIISKEVNTVNEAYNNRLKRMWGLGRKRITKKKQDDEQNSISKNNLKNEDTNQSITNKDFHRQENQVNQDIVNKDEEIKKLNSKIGKLQHEQDEAVYQNNILKEQVLYEYEHSKSKQNDHRLDEFFPVYRKNDNIQESVKSEDNNYDNINDNLEEKRQKLNASLERLSLDNTAQNNALDTSNKEDMTIPSIVKKKVTFADKESKINNL